MIMKFAGWLSAAFFVLAVVAFVDASRTYAAEDSWRSGGTLRSSFQKEWIQASPENKLASTSEWVVEYMGQENAASISNDELREMSENVISCVERKFEPYLDLPILPNAVLCMIIMDYPRAGS